MPVVIDIGNTSSKICRICPDGAVAEEGIFEDRIAEMAITGALNDEIIISSVVPSKTQVISAMIREMTGKDPFIVGHDKFPGLRSRYKVISELGNDRLCNIAYALSRFGSNTIIIDLGSAVTFEIIGRDGVFEGGMILPGIKLQYSSLSVNTALLPSLRAENETVFIGRSTAECIISGVQNGIAGVCDSFVKNIRSAFSQDMRVVLSGGDSELVSKLVNFGHQVEKHTVVLGAYEIYKMSGK